MWKFCGGEMETDDLLCQSPKGAVERQRIILISIIDSFTFIFPSFSISKIKTTAAQQL